MEELYKNGFPVLVEPREPSDSGMLPGEEEEEEKDDDEEDEDEESDDEEEEETV